MNFRKQENELARRKFQDLSATTILITFGVSFFLRYLPPHPLPGNLLGFSLKKGVQKWSHMTLKNHP